MASPTTAAAPDAPSGSSPLSINGLPRLVGWFVEIVNFIKAVSPSGASAYDTGWVTLAPTAAYPLYSAQPIEVRRVGKFVELNGVVKPAAAGQLSGTICVLPADMRPKASVYFICQGSGNDRWMLGVFPNGDVAGGRYGPGTPAVGAWLPFTATWLVD